MLSHSFRPKTSRQTGFVPAYPCKYKPMLMHASAQPFVRENWLFEPKLDGMRGIVSLTGGRCKILSRNGLDFAVRYPALAQQLLSLGIDAVLDGEIVAFGDNGMPSFERLQERIRMNKERDIDLADMDNPVTFYVFDILELQGTDLTSKRLSDRKQILCASVAEQPLVKHTQVFPEDGITLFKACAETGLEGIVGKNANSRYESGVRSKQWIKVKLVQTADVVIGGHKDDVGFLVGRFADDGSLRYCGTVITGLRGADYDYLDGHLTRRQTCPFESTVSKWNAHWFEPTVVAEVKFMHWTSGGYLRMPSFTRLRPDVPAPDVVLQP